MKRRRALKILGSATAPLIVPSVALPEVISLGQQVRASLAGRSGSLGETLTEAQDRSVTALAEVIIPETDTPGASQAGVTEFVDALATGWLDDADRDRFLEGLDAVDRDAQARYGSAFADCSPAQQAEMVQSLDDRLDRLRGDPDQDHTRDFFYDMKRFTLAGFFTSRVGLETLGVRLIPGAFEGCVLLDQFGTGRER